MVRQYTINLNREEGYLQREARRAKIRTRITNVVATLLLLAMAFITYQNDAEIREIVDGKERQLRRIVAQIDSLQKVGQNVSKDDVLALARLDRDRVLWTKKLRAVSERLPEKVVVTGLHLERSKLEIDAMSEIEANKKEKEFEKVEAFMEKLRNTPLFFEDIQAMKFKESKRIEKGEQELLIFTIKCDVRSAETSRSRRGTRRTSKAGSPQVGG